MHTFWPCLQNLSRSCNSRTSDPTHATTCCAGWVCHCDPDPDIPILKTSQGGVREAAVVSTKSGKHLAAWLFIRPHGHLPRATERALTRCCLNEACFRRSEQSIWAAHFRIRQPRAATARTVNSQSRIALKGFDPRFPQCGNSRYTRCPRDTAHTLRAKI
jgi:hypothetical protein